MCSGTIRVLYLKNLLFLKVILILIFLVLLVERYQIVKYLKNNRVSENIYLFFFVALALIMFRAVMFIKKIFLGGAPTSIPHFFCPFVCPSICRISYLRNRTSSNHNFWYTSVKWWYLQVFCHFVRNVIFWTFTGVKGQKIAQKEK